MPGSSADGAVGKLWGHAILCRYGRVGRVVAEARPRRRFPFVVIEQDRRLVGALHRLEIRTACGDAGRPDSLSLAGLSRARVVIVAVSDPVVARRVNIAARTRGETDRAILERLGADEAVLAELEVVRHVLRRFGVSPLEGQGLLRVSWRRRTGRDAPKIPGAVIRLRPG